MTTKTRTTRKPATKTDRTMRLYHGTPALLEMAVGKETFAYWLEQIPADFGIGIEFRKMLECGGDVYHVNIDTQGDRHSCECKGFLRHQHCKHVESALALQGAGKLLNLPGIEPVKIDESKPAPATKWQPVPGKEDRFIYGPLHDEDIYGNCCI